MIELRTKSPLTIVGVNLGHDGGACIIHKNKIISISEERLTRNKKGYGYLSALFYCLKSLKITVKDIDYVAFSTYHKRLPKGYLGLFESLGFNKKQSIIIDHHESHAYGSYYLSGFDEALVVVMDGMGNVNMSESYYLAKGNKVKIIGHNDLDRSIYAGVGRAYESFTNFIGWPTTCAGKTMGLSAYGKGNYKNIRLFKIDDNLRVSADLKKKYGASAEEFLSRKHLSELLTEKGKLSDAKEVAKLIQDKTEDLFVDLIKKLVEKTGIRKLCLTGGCALNCVANQKLLDLGIVDEIFVPPYPCDTGQAVGNAIAGLAKKKIYIKERLPHPYFGRMYDRKEILDVLQKKQEIYPLPYEIKIKDYDFKEILDEKKYNEIIADYIKHDLVVGWFQGDSELGPRALGHRSILANPTSKTMKDHINMKVKKREPFRPFAASLCDDDVETYFKSGLHDRFMSFAIDLKEKYIPLIPAVLHVDNTCRLQSVSKKENPKYYSLIKELKKKIGVPMVLNTSFNEDKEPIVETPVDALRHLAVGNIDVLAMDDFIVRLKK